MHSRTYPWSLVIALFIAYPAYSQETFPVRSAFSWEKIEKKVLRAQIDQFIRSFPKEFEIYWGEASKLNNLNMDSLATYLHFIDVNADGRLDVIYNGRSDGEGTIIKVFMNLGASYKKAFSEMESIFRMDLKDGRLYRLYIHNDGCCDDYIVINKIFQVSYDHVDKPMFVQIYQGTAIHQGGLPDTVWEKPLRFEVLNEKYKIRSFPVVDDISPQPWHEEGHPDHGNVIGTLSKGARGTALARKTDSSGREWWYVEIDEEFYPAGDVLLKETQNDFPTKAIGWVSSRFVKVL